MKQYLLSIYQPDGEAPAPEVLEPIMRDVEAGATVGGIPAVPFTLHMRQIAILARLARKRDGR